MSNKKSVKHRLLITYNIISKSKRFYYLFKPKEVVVAEPCEISFKIKNIGNKSFPGGDIPYLNIKHIETDEQTEYYENTITIPKISIDEEYPTLILPYIPVNSGNTWLYLAIRPKSGEIEYYQWERAKNIESSLGDKDRWQDYFYIASRQEMHQRYTNYILLFLTSLTTILFIINIALLLGVKL